MEDNKKITFLIYDPPGVERYRPVNRVYYPLVQVYIIVITGYSFPCNWLDEIKKYGNQNSYKVIVRNKVDIIDENRIISEGEKLAKVMNIPYFEISAKNNINIDEVFNFIGKEILKSYEIEIKDEKKIEEKIKLRVAKEEKIKEKETNEINQEEEESQILEFIKLKEEFSKIIVLQNKRIKEMEEKLNNSEKQNTINSDKNDKMLIITLNERISQKDEEIKH